MIRSVPFLLLIAIHMQTLHAQEIIPLYNSDIPNSIPTVNSEWAETTDGILRVFEVSQPRLTVYLPEKSKATGDAIVVCPGGGYGMLAAGHEGKDVALKLNEMGIAAFVLHYRLPNAKWIRNPETGPMQDAQRAIIIVKENAPRFNIKSDRVGILGFSAGGHLASTAATHFSKIYLPKKWAPRNKSWVRPDFCVLIYPVISFSDSIGHIGSRENLLGKNASAEKIREYSNELHVTPNTPPTFLVHAKNDPVSYKNSEVFADALSKNGIFSELLFFEAGGHGFGLVNPESEIQWIERMAVWLQKLKSE